ncbi:MAG TPA: hypothetical protein VIF82_19105 [Burkholderiaceae bacterium]
MPSEQHNDSLSMTERKRLLVAQGAAHRLAITHARADVRTSLSAESLAKSAIAHVAMGAFAAIKGGSILRGANLGNLQVLLPLAMSVIARLSKKTHLVKPLVRGALVLGAVAAITRFVIRKKNAGKMKKR